MTVVNWDVDLTAKKARMEVLKEQFPSLPYSAPSVSPPYTCFFQDFGTGSGVVWVKTLSQWLTMALYTWTLIAQTVLTNCCGLERSFDFT